jgi:hypothetical protein
MFFPPVSSVKKNVVLSTHLLPSGPSGDDGADEDDTNDPRGEPRRHVLQLFHGEQNARQGSVETWLARDYMCTL